MELLRKQVVGLAEENGKLVGHQNLHQKIQYVVRLKKENVRLAEVSAKNCWPRARRRRGGDSSRPEVRRRRGGDSAGLRCTQRCYSIMSQPVRFL